MRSYLPQKLAAISDLIRLPKQHGTLLLMFPAMWSLFVAADGTPPWHLIAVFALGAFLMRSAGCAFNDIADQNLDRHVWRTKDRPIASARLSTNEGLLVFFTVVALASPLAFLLNRLAMILAVIGLLLAVAYPFSKRHIAIPQALLGIAFGWGALVAWASIRNEIEIPGLLIFIATIFWAVAYDTIYAIMDKNDDIGIGIKSSAILFGRYTWFAVGSCYFLGLLTLVLLGQQTELGAPYYFTLFLVSLLFLYHTYKLKKGISHRQALTLFKSNVYVGLIILLGILLDLTVGNTLMKFRL